MGMLVPLPPWLSKEERKREQAKRDRFFRLQSALLLVGAVGFFVEFIYCAYVILMP